MKARRLGMIIVAIAVVVSVVLVVLVSVENTTILVIDSHPDGSLQYNADYTFAGIGDFSIRGSCPMINGSTTECDLNINVALSNHKLATKTITLELTGLTFSQLAIASGLDDFPVRVSYSMDNSGDKFATLNLPDIVAGSTWYYDFLILNPPTSNGSAILNLILNAQIVSTSFIGHSYNLEAEVQLPSPN
jgi:hypothetical protein